MRDRMRTTLNRILPLPLALTTTACEDDSLTGLRESRGCAWICIDIPTGPLPGDSTPALVPVEVAGDHRFSEIGLSVDEGCGVTEAGGLFCWGFPDRPAPARILGDGVAKSVSVAAGERCHVLTAGGASCNADRLVRFPEPLVTVSAGGRYLVDFACGLAATGRAYCWGWMANRSWEPDYPAQEVPGDHRFTRISSGADHACGLDLDGAALCWGQNDVGQLGDGTREARTEPVAVAGPDRYTWISAGLEETCAVTVEQLVKCWGRVPTERYRPEHLTPFALPGFPALTSLSGAGSDWCGLTAEGQAFCWGSNYRGRLGDGTTTDRYTVAAPVATTVRFNQIVSYGGTSCAVALDGKGWCWGSDTWHMLGNGP